MYAEHFGLSEPPFNATPDPRFFYSNPAYDEAYATLLYGLEARQGFIVLTGEVGTGKTTLLRRLMDELTGRARFVFLSQNVLTPDELLEGICAELELPVDGGRFRQLRTLNEFLIGAAERAETVALLVDEAQNLGTEVLEHLRLISNLETSREKLLQIVLTGQPELHARLADPRVRQVRQRIVMRYHLLPLPRAEVGAFIRHRLRVAGRDARLFSADAVNRVAMYSGGVPRLINILCNGALLIAFAGGARMVNGRMVEEAARDLLLGRGRAPEHGRAGPVPGAPRMPRGRRWIPVGGGIAAALLAGAAIVVGLDDPTTLHRRDAPQRVDPPILATAGAAGAPPAASVAAPEPAGDPVAASEHATVTRARGPAAYRIAMPRGASVSEIAAGRYPGETLLALDLIEKLNPDVKNLSRIGAGQLLWLPDLAGEARVRRDRTGAYRLILTSLPEPDAVRLARAVRRNGYVPVVTSRTVTPDMTVHRVEIAHLADREAVVHAWQHARGQGWVTGPPPAVPSRRARARAPGEGPHD
ncbi:MAG TPA: AAA family ATPase [Candidatus Tectomicrobia bacterium]|nr:AAA family ATPase [Candidatus Tectomicrobia bacterium]